MMTMIIIIGSVVLAAAFSLAWLLEPRLRERIEAPKHWFGDQVRQYDRDCRETREDPSAASNESR
jgi:hypothetical protein